MTGPRYLLRLMVTITLTSTAHRLSCDPGELFTSHNLTCDVSQSSSSFIWKRNHNDISICTSSTSICAIVEQYKRSYTAYFMNQTIVLNIMKVTRETEGNYSCSDKNSNVVQTCDFRVNDRHQDSPLPSGEAVNMGAIVGGTLAGSLVIVVLVVLILVFLRRKDEAQVTCSPSEDVSVNNVTIGINDMPEPTLTLKLKPIPKPRTAHLCDDRTLQKMKVTTIDLSYATFIKEIKSSE